MNNRLLIVCLLLTPFLLGGCFFSPPRQTTLPPEIAAEALQYAFSVEGAPYAWAGNGPHEFDCSGLIVWSYRQAYPDLMFRIGRKRVVDVSMDDIYRYNSVPLKPSELRPGDLVFITDSDHRITHGGLFIHWIDESTFRFINASSTHNAVVVDTWPLDGRVRDQWFAGAGRLQTVF
ncbi:MAG: C40 family peptidase [Firmicutes bacterium]|nr:C40 family peptidase [Bacillota bacterium]